MFGPNKNKFGRRAMEDVESSCGSNEEIEFETIFIGKILVSMIPLP